MGRYGLGTRIAMIVIGAIWVAAGAAWLYVVGPGFFREHHISRLYAIPVAVVIGGLGLLKTGLMPDRPKSFEDEIPDANPRLTDDDGTDDWTYLDD
jgi:hypothetical protein